jgi:hypothetical protein
MADSSSTQGEQSSGKRKSRGPTTCLKMKNKPNEQKHIEFDDKLKPIGIYAANFKNYLGSLVRSHVDITIDNWKNVESGLKDMIWDDLQVCNVLRFVNNYYLRTNENMCQYVFFFFIQKEFNVEGDIQIKKKHFLKVAGVRWTAHKTKLVSDFITKKHPKYNHPSELYPSITEEQWKKFVDDHQTEEFKACSVLPFFF